jgi:pimeloyl-ACP methyl ester carboxylesterase
MRATAAEIIAFVKTLGPKTIDLFGFSIGGMVAQQVVLDAPELVRRILLVGAGPSGGEGMKKFTRELIETVNRPNSTEQERTLDLFFSKVRRVARRARPGSSGSPRESWSAKRERSPQIGEA